MGESALRQMHTSQTKMIHCGAPPAIRQVQPVASLGDENVAMTRKRWVAVAVTAVLGLTLGATAFVVWQHVRPRLPALSAAAPALDRAIATVVNAAGDDAAVTVSGLVPVTSCEHTPLAKGSRFTRTANLYTDPGGEDAVIDHVAAALPPSEHPVRSAPSPSGVSGLTATLGGGITLQVIAIGDGWLAATAETDCRTGAADPPPAGPQPASLVDPVTQILIGLGTQPTGFHSETVACARGHITTLDTASAATSTGNLATRLAKVVPPGARQFASTSNRLAWRVGGVSTIVAASDDGTEIDVQRTTGC
jgi:hypothetical protein